jgi:hypothetical protein
VTGYYYGEKNGINLPRTNPIVGFCKICDEQNTASAVKGLTPSNIKDVKSKIIGISKKSRSKHAKVPIC